MYFPGWLFVVLSAIIFIKTQGTHVELEKCSIIGILCVDPNATLISDDNTLSVVMSSLPLTSKIEIVKL